MIVRRIDSLGRIVIPKTYREQLGIKHADNLTINLTNNSILITKEVMNFDINNFIVKFIVDTYGVEYQDMLISNVVKKDIYKLLKQYFDTRLLRRENEKNV